MARASNTGPPEPDPAHEAAEEYRRQLDGMGVVASTWREGDIVRATTGGVGVHLLNQADEFNADVHLICATDGVREAGNLPDRDDLDHGPIFFNVKVRGFAAEGAE